jgi:nitrile hydratase
VNGVHDVGGADGFGRVDPPAHEPVFHTDWERRTFAMSIPVAMAGVNLDQVRHGIERLHPVDYLCGRYYEHWLHSFENNLIEKGVISAEELERRARHFREHPEEDLPAGGDPEQAEQFVAIQRAGASARRPTDVPPAFRVGDRVRVRNMHPSGHTRAARYVRGKEGVVTQVYDAFVLPDSNAKDEGENPARVYNVEFTSTELWGADEDRGHHTVRFDLFEPYIEAA